MRGSVQARIEVQRGGFALATDLRVAAGRTLAVLGRNGAGKSTVLAALAGITGVTAGRIVLDGVPLDDPESGTFVAPERRATGIVLQQPALFPHLSALDNVAFGLRTTGLRRGAARTAAAEVLAANGLTDLARRMPAQLSGGQAARVALARTLARRPSLLLLDEPLAAIDAELRPELRDRIAGALTEFDGSAVLVTHDVRDAEVLADEVLVLDAGRPVQRGTLAELRANPAAPIVARLVAPQTSMKSSGSSA